MNAETVKQENQEDLAKKEGQEEAVEKNTTEATAQENLIVSKKKLNKGQLL